MRPSPQRFKERVAVSAVRQLGRRKPRCEMSECIAMFGAPRSGTTWTGEVLQRLTGKGIVNEPLFYRRLPALEKYFGTSSRPYRAPDAAREPGLDKLLAEVLTGRLLQAGSVFRTPSQLWPFLRHRGVIVKEVRGHLLVPYVRKRFPELPVIVIVRDPRAVAASQMRHGSEVWGSAAGLSASYDPLFGERPDLRPPEGEVSAVGASVMRWCVEHAYLESRPEEIAGVHLVRYEDMLSDPEGELRRLSAFLGAPISRDVGWTLGGPSRSSKYGSNILDGTDPVTAWESRLDERDKQTSAELLAHYRNPFGYR